jgi:16S rRNA processing protein RimM
MQKKCNKFMNDEWIEIGKVVGAQGLKGELRIYPSSDFPERFEEPGKRWLQNPQTQAIQEIELLEGYNIPGKNLYVISLDGIEDRNQAEALKGYKLLVAGSDRPQIEEDEYHVSELIDVEVYHQATGKKIGIIIDVYWAGNDLLEVKLDEQPTLADQLLDSDRKQKKQKKQPKPATVLIPFVKEIVPVVDLNHGRIEITPPPGLLEINR